MSQLNENPPQVLMATTTAAFFNRYNIIVQLPTPFSKDHNPIAERSSAVNNNVQQLSQVNHGQPQSCRFPVHRHLLTLVT